MNRPLLKLVVATLALCASALAHAQSAWPSKPVRIIAVFPPGGSVDQVARIFAAHLTQQLGQQFIVENRGGASGSIGTQVVAAAAPDGYTFGVVFDTHAVNPALIPTLAFDTLKDLAPVMLVGTSPMAIVAHESQPYKDFRDVIAAAKAKPGAVAIGSIGTGSLGHLAVTQIGNQTYCYLAIDGKAVRTPVQTGVGDGSWVAVTGKLVRPAGSSEGAWEAFDGTEAVIGPAPDTYPQLLFNLVPEQKDGKNRLHVDFKVEDLDAAEARVKELGGRRLSDYDPGGFLVMADPEGNVFCLLPLGRDVGLDDEGIAHYH